MIWFDTKRTNYGRKRWFTHGSIGMCVLLVFSQTMQVCGFMLTAIDPQPWRQPCTFVCGCQQVQRVTRLLKTRAQETTRRTTFQPVTSSLVSPGPARLLSYVAEVGLKLKLKSHGVVQVTIDSTPAELLRGSVQGVTVSGTLWASPFLLTCRTIEATVGETSVALDALARGQIDLKQPALGTCTVVFNGGTCVFFA